MCGKAVFVFWNDVRFAGWYSGVITGYDSVTKKHSIAWDDGDKDWVEDLMCCKRCKEWRFVQEGEDVDAFLE